MILAITGGTGFVGSHLIDHALETGHTVRALARKPQAKRIGVTWIEGALDRPKSLATLVEGADVVIHVAGVVNAANRAGFAEGNVAGTEGILQATKHAGIRRFVHVSSLAAREPTLSNYGWSKAEAETRVEASGLDWTIVRPPAIFGPRDHDLLDVFKAARSGFVPVPPVGTRISLLYVEDLTTLLLALAEILVPKKYRSWVPSPTGLGLGMVLPFFYPLAMFMGAAFGAIATAANRKWAERYIVAIAAGGIAGESIIGVLVQALNNFVLH